MRRKVIKQAKSAYTLTLPIEWVRANKIDEKSEVEVAVEGRSLAIMNTGRVSERKAKLNVSGLGMRNLYRHINALYAAGVDEIELTSEEEISAKIIRLLNSLIGYVLVSQSTRDDPSGPDESYLYVIKDIGGGAGGDLDEIFKRAFQAVILFYDSAYKDIFGCGCETDKSLRMRDLEVNKLCLYLQRAINKMSYKDPIRGRALFSYSIELEKIGDDILRLWRANIGAGTRKSAKLKELIKSSKGCLEKSFDLYYRLNSKGIESLYELREKVRKQADGIKGHDKLVRQALRIAEGAADLSHMTLMIRLE